MICLIVNCVERRKLIPRPQYIASFSSSVSGEASITDSTYYPNKVTTEETISSNQLTDATQVLTFSSQRGKVLYIIGFLLKYYHLAGRGVGRSLIKNETENSTTVELGSQKYSSYSAYGLGFRILSSPTVRGTSNEWLSISERYQLIACSTTGLQSFLDPEAYSQWNKSLEMRMLFSRVPN
eukprot:jgi/Galph1/5463/GphlegSOOS_G4103.1